MASATYLPLDLGEDALLPQPAADEHHLRQRARVRHLRLRQHRRAVARFPSSRPRSSRNGALARGSGCRKNFPVSVESAGAFDALVKVPPGRRRPRSRHDRHARHHRATRSTTSKPASRRAALAKALAGSAVLAAAATEALTGVVRASGVDLAINTHAGQRRDADRLRRLRDHARDGARADGADRRRDLPLGEPAGPRLVPGDRRPRRPVLRPRPVEPGTSTATRLTLMAAHVVAAAIIVPAVGRRLR